MNWIRRRQSIAFGAIVASSICVLDVSGAAITVDLSRRMGLVKPVNGVGQPPMVGAMSGWPMFRYLKDAGIPYSRLHDVGGWLGGGLYVDIPNLFPDFGADETKPENYRFAYTDSLLLGLKENGVEPFFRLGVSIENFVGSGLPPVRTIPPSDYLKWARICEHVISHYTEGWADGPKINITYWEIWNEPDNMQDARKNPMWGAPFSEYIRFYGVVAPYLKARFPDIKVGGYGSCGFYAGVGANGVSAANSSPRMEYFIDCAKEFLSAVRNGGWPLDFFSYHSYSKPSVALRQVLYADALLDEYGFSSKKTERVFNEWLPSASVENLGSALQASDIAAELIGLQNGPCDIACIYDARCGVGAYSPLFNPLTQKPHKAYYAFLAFNELRKLRTAVACRCDDDGIFAAAASDGMRFALMVANATDDEKPLELYGVPVDSVCRMSDASQTAVAVPIPRSSPARSFFVVTGVVRKGL